MIIHVQVTSDLWSLKFFIIREKHCWSNICACTSKFLQTNQGNFQMNSAIHKFVQGLSTIVIHQLLTFCIWREVYTVLASEYSRVCHVDTHAHAHAREKAQFKVALRRCLHILFFFWWIYVEKCFMIILSPGGNGFSVTLAYFMQNIYNVL